MISRKEVRVPKNLWWHTNPSYVSFKMPRDLDATLEVSWASLVAQVVKKKNKKPTCQCRRHKKCGFNPWVRKILPGQFHGQRSLAGYSPWVRNESDMTERLTQTHTLLQKLSYVCFQHYFTHIISTLAASGSYTLIENTNYLRDF